jgi:hypothetical protein
MYVDEFQNFATTAYANISSESRKYRLNLTMAHQYIQQLPNEVRAAVIGNVGNMVAFRVGGEDAQIFAKEFEPVFTPNDFIDLNVRNFYIKMSIGDQTSAPFSARTITLTKPTEDKSQDIIEISRKKWARTRKEVEEEINRWEKGEIREIKKTEKQQPAVKGVFFPEPII